VPRLNRQWRGAMDFPSGFQTMRVRHVHEAASVSISPSAPHRISIGRLRNSAYAAEPMQRGWQDRSPSYSPQNAKLGIAQLHRLLKHRLKHRREVARR